MEPDDIVALNLGEIAHRAEEIAMQGAGPNPGLAPYFGSDMPAGFRYVSCVEFDHLYHGAIEVRDRDTPFEIIVGVPTDGGEVVINVPMTLASLLESLYPDFNIEPINVVTPEQAAAKGVKIERIPNRKEQEQPYPGFYL